MSQETTLSFCKTFSDSSHVTVLWSEREGARLHMPDDLWSLPHDLAGGFLRRVAEGRPTADDNAILQDCFETARLLAGRSNASPDIIKEP